MLSFHDVIYTAGDTYGMVLPGQETLCKTLIVASILGRQDAIYQLLDILEEHSVDAIDRPLLERVLVGTAMSYRKLFTPEAKYRFRQDAKAAGVYKGR